MNSHRTSADPALAAPPPAHAAGARLPLGVVVLGLAMIAAAAAACAAAVLEAWIAVAPTWAALWGAVFGVITVALPAAVLAVKSLRPAAPAQEPAPDAAGRGVVSTRALFFQLAEREWARARRYSTGAALLLVDIDRYPRLCESRGAEAGAAALSELMRSVAATLRGVDVLTRLADGQLAIFLAQADATGALDVAERIRDRAERLELHWAEQQLCITVSVGVAHLRPAHQHMQSLIEDARNALAVARQAGGNCLRTAPHQPDRIRPAGAWRDDRRAPKRQHRP